ncbi:phasin [Salinarimonas soli]|uniref:Phasin n=1 Tax=Salinarimonas soli TaxID=1638099 RepID=A0A5B2VVH6_9HYPH|nr:phasin [Salinarimonas soli]KAA2242206.1 phasin [Salinarimonas soli]
MTDEKRGYEIPTEMRDFAEKSVEQARKAMDGFIGAAQRAMDTFDGSANPVQTSAVDLSRRSLALAEQNLGAAFEHAQRLVRAKDPAEAMRLQAEFVQSQFQAMQSQMREFGGLMQNAAGQAAKTAQSAAESVTPRGGKKS